MYLTRQLSEGDKPTVPPPKAETLETWIVRAHCDKGSLQVNPTCLPETLWVWLSLFVSHAAPLVICPSQPCHCLAFRCLSHLCNDTTPLSLQKLTLRHSQLCGLFFLHIQNSLILNVYVSELDVTER